MNFHHATLSNGLDVIAEVDSNALSTAVSFFVRTGSRDETPEISGVSHFLEHMAFKGTKQRSAEEMNRQFDEIGAKYNAYTTEEHTVYHAAVLPEYLESAFDLLSDLIRPVLRKEDFEIERKVILEEIAMYAEMPMWIAYERAMRVHFSGHPLGNSVPGTKESVSNLTDEAMHAYHQKRYGPSNLFVAAAGKLDFDALLGMVTEQCGNLDPVQTPPRVHNEPHHAPSELIRADQFVQQCLFLLSPAPACNHSLRFAAEVLANIVGDETGSRFHWTLTEPGKVESAEFEYHEYEDIGLFMTSASCEPALVQENLALIRQIFEEISREGVTQEELVQARNKLGSRIVLAAERPQNRLFSLGYNWSNRKEYRSVADDLRDLDAVTGEDIQTVLKNFPLREQTTICLGPLKKLANLLVSEQ